MYQQKVASELRFLRLQLDRSIEDLYQARRTSNLGQVQAIQENISNLKKAIEDLESTDFCLDTGRHSMPPPATTTTTAPSPRSIGKKNGTQAPPPQCKHLILTRSRLYKRQCLDLDLHDMQSKGNMISHGKCVAWMFGEWECDTGILHSLLTANVAYVALENCSFSRRNKLSLSEGVEHLFFSK